MLISYLFHCKITCCYSTYPINHPKIAIILNTSYMCLHQIHLLSSAFRTHIHAPKYMRYENSSHILVVVNYRYTYEGFVVIYSFTKYQINCIFGWNAVFGIFSIHGIYWAGHILICHISLSVY